MAKHAKTGIENRQAFGDAIAERLKSAPFSLKKPAAAFVAQQKAYAAAEERVRVAKGARDRAIDAIGDADTVLDRLVGKLSDALIGAGLTTRRSPFGGLSALSPSQVCALAYKKEVAEVRAIVAKVLARKPSTGVKTACAACAKQASSVEAALKALTRPQNEYTKAIAARDAILLPLEKALTTLRAHAAVAFDGDAASLKALFAPPEAMQAPAKRRRTAAKKAITNGAPAVGATEM